MATDRDLAVDLATCYPLLAGATSVLPGPTWTASAQSAIQGGSPTLGASVVRALQPLTGLEGPANAGLPGIPGVLRPTNQRIARGLLWMAAMLDPAWAAEALPDLASHFGTSARRDRTTREYAVASTSVALLGEIGTPAAVSGLARVAARVSNVPLTRQVRLALERAGRNAGAGHDHRTITGDPGPQDVDLPDFGLDQGGRRLLPVGDWTAAVGISDRGSVTTRWVNRAGVVRDAAPRGLRDRHPDRVREVSEVRRRIEGTLAEERTRPEAEFGLNCRRPFERWHLQFVENPVGAAIGRRLVWTFETSGGLIAGLAVGPILEDIAGRQVRPSPGSTVGLWHPVDAAPADVEAWRDRIVTARISQPAKQVFRESYSADPSTADAALDRRFAGHALDQRKLRGLAVARGWRGAALGAWDQGAEATMVREFAGTGWQAELAIEAAGRHDAAEAAPVVRTGSVRFIRAEGRGHFPALVAAVPPRIFSEAMRDVDLFTSVADITRFSPRDETPDEASALLAARSAALRRLLGVLPFGARLTIFGRWLRVDGRVGYVISLADGSTLRADDEVDMGRAAEADATPAILELVQPIADDPLLVAIVARASRLVTET